MNFNFKFKLKDLDGNPIKGDAGNAGKVLANALSMSNKGQAIKLHDWALKLWNEKPIDIDETDSDVLYALIESSEYLTVIGKVPILQYIKSVKDKSKPR